MSADDAETYGKHSRAHAHGLGVAELLRRVIARGEAIRLAWHSDETTRVADDSQDFPTAVLPVIRDEYPGDDEDTDPSTGVREARKWFNPELSLWWRNSLVG
jgi:hypothetical protein